MWKKQTLLRTNLLELCIKVFSPLQICLQGEANNKDQHFQMHVPYVGEEFQKEVSVQSQLKNLNFCNLMQQVQIPMNKHIVSKIHLITNVKKQVVVT